MTQPVRISHGLWRAPEQVADLLALCATLLTALPPFSVVAGLAAARLHGLWLPPGSTDDPVDVIVRHDAPVPRRLAASRRREVRARRRVVRPDEVTVIGGVPVTSIERTWADLAERLLPYDLVSAGDSALRAGATRAELEEMVARAGHRRGVVRAREAIGRLDGRSRSRPETWMRLGLVDCGLPMPQVNVAVFDEHGQWLGEPDLSYDDVRLALEYNGADHAQVPRMRKDITRVFDIDSRGGWRTVTLGPVEVFQRMDQVAAFVHHLRRAHRP